MDIRNGRTLHRMWDESLTLRDRATKHAAEEDACTAAAESAERDAAAHRVAAAAAGKTARGLADEAADLADMVNEKRAAAGLSALKPGDPYPAEKPEADRPVDMPRAGAPAGTPVTLADLGRVPRDGTAPPAAPPASFGMPVAGQPADPKLADLTRLAQDGGQQQ